MSVIRYPSGWGGCPAVYTAWLSRGIAVNSVLYSFLEFEGEKPSHAFPRTDFTACWLLLPGLPCCPQASSRLVFTTSRSKGGLLLAVLKLFTRNSVCRGPVCTVLPGASSISLRAPPEEVGQGSLPCGLPRFSHWPFGYSGRSLGLAHWACGCLVPTLPGQAGFRVLRLLAGCPGFSLWGSRWSLPLRSF